MHCIWNIAHIQKGSDMWKYCYKCVTTGYEPLNLHVSIDFFNKGVNFFKGQRTLVYTLLVILQGQGAPASFKWHMVTSMRPQNHKWTLKVNRLVYILLIKRIISPIISFTSLFLLQWKVKKMCPVLGCA